MSGLATDFAVIVLLAIAGWLVGAVLIPDRWISARRRRRRSGVGTLGWRVAVLRVIARVGLRVALWAAWRATLEASHGRGARRVGVAGDDANEQQP